MLKKTGRSTLHEAARTASALLSKIDDKLPSGITFAKVFQDRSPLTELNLASGDVADVARAMGYLRGAADALGVDRFEFFLALTQPEHIDAQARTLHQVVLEIREWDEELQREMAEDAVDCCRGVKLVPDDEDYEDDDIW